MLIYNRLTALGVPDQHTALPSCVTRTSRLSSVRDETHTHSCVGFHRYPEDTDVLHVLVRSPRIPEYVMTDHFIYRIDPDGKINFLGTH